MKRKEAPPGVKIGLEVHCQLTALRTKLFCGCSSDYRDGPPNEKVCPVCFGLPGTLPVLNSKAVDFAVRIADALGCRIPPETTFYRKNYFYPDLPKNFQISQYDRAGGVPIASGGRVSIGGKVVGIRRIQLEEDPGKLTYEGTIEKSSYSLVDYNRAGIALVEIVTEPDFRSAREAKAFLEKLRETLEALGVSNGELEGSMRCDANVSVEGGERVEVKNISSFKEVEKALNYEVLRQGTFGGVSRGAAETRHWDERRSITISLRVKEGEQDYRYFPEPDVPAVALNGEYLAGVRRAAPEVPEVRAERYMRRYGLSPQAARALSRDALLAAFFEETEKSYAGGPEIANWLLGEVREGDRKALEGSEARVTPRSLADLLARIERGELTRAHARRIFRETISRGTNSSRSEYTEEAGVIRDEEAVGRLVREVLSDRDAAEKAKSDKKAFNYLVGRVLRLEPRADPALVAKTLSRMLRGD